MKWPASLIFRRLALNLPLSAFLQWYQAFCSGFQVKCICRTNIHAKAAAYATVCVPCQLSVHYLEGIHLAPRDARFAGRTGILVYVDQVPGSDNLAWHRKPSYGFHSVAMFPAAIAQQVGELVRPVGISVYQPCFFRLVEHLQALFLCQPFGKMPPNAKARGFAKNHAIIRGFMAGLTKQVTHMPAYTGAGSDVFSIFNHCCPR